MLISLMPMWKIKEQMFPKKLFSLNNCLISVEITYSHWCEWTRFNECGIKECGTKEYRINFRETTFNSQT